jgi:ADP-heptose:LPS heptosyltransferase
MHLPIAVAESEKETVETKALLDCGAGGTFIDQRFVKTHGLMTHSTREPILVRNVDGTLNKNGTITQSTILDLKINGKTMKTRFHVTRLGKETIILGLPWLRAINPDIDWKKGTFKFRKDLRQTQIQQIVAKTKEKMMPFGQPKRFPKPTVEEIPDEELTTLTLPNTLPISPQDTSPPEITVNDLTTEPLETKPKPEEQSSPHLEEDNLHLCDEIADDEVLIAYVRGKPVIGIFRSEEPSPTIKFDEPKFSYSQTTGKVSCLMKSPSSSCYRFSSAVHIQAKTPVSQKLAHESVKDQEANKKTLDELLPEHYQEYKQVFEKAASERFPERKPWDHTIDLKEDFVPRDCKIYPLTPSEDTLMNNFLDKNLAKGYIQPSKSPMASPFFFVAKKDALAL